MVTTRTRSTAWLPLLFVLALALAACGGEAGEAEVSEPATGTTEGTAAGSGGGPDSPAAEPTALTVGVAVFGTNIYWDLYVADQEGFFEDAGLEVEFLDFSGPSDTISALAGGSVDIAHLATDGILLAAEQGVDLRLLAAGSYPASSLVVDPSITSYDDLAGKKFGVADIDAGSTQVAVALLRANGVDIEDMEVVPVGGGSPDRIAALEAGVIDVAAMSQPWDLRAQEAGFTLLGNTAEVLDTYPFASITAMADFIEAEESTVAAYVAAVVQGQAWVNDPANKERAIEIFMEASGSEEDLATEVYELYIEELAAMPTDGRFDPDGVAQLLEVLGNTTAGADVTQEDVDRILDPRFLPGQG